MSTQHLAQTRDPETRYRVRRRFSSSRDRAEGVDAFRKRYEVDRYPQLLAFRDDILQDRKIGFDGLPATRAFVTGFLGSPTSVDESERGQVFEAAYKRAKRSFEERLQPASDAIAPYLDAIFPEAARLEQQVAEAVKRGKLNLADARDTLSKRYALLCAPFQAKVDAWREAHAAAMHLFETIMAEEVCTYARCKR